MRKHVKGDVNSLCTKLSLGGIYNTCMMRGRGSTRKIVEVSNQTQSAHSSAQNKHRLSSGGQYENEDGLSDGLGSKSTQYPQKYPALPLGDLDGSHDIDIDLTRARAHVTKFRLTGNLTITISNPPPIIEGMLIFVEITQDEIGFHTIIWPSSVKGNPQPDSTPNSKSLIALFTTDQGQVFHKIGRAHV